MNFLKTFLASFLALLIFTVFSFFMVIGIASIASTSSEPKKLDEESILQISFNQPINEQGAEDPFEGLDLPFASPDRGIGLNEILGSIKNAALDPNILALYLNFSGFPGGMAKAYEIRSEIEKFKESGKPVIFYGDFLSESGYYLASVADSIFLNPNGIVEFNGANVEMVFFKGSLEKLEVKPEVFKVGKYKSAVEPFIRSDMSEESREQTLELVDGFYGHFLQEISRSRGIEEQRLKEISSGMLAKTPNDLKEHGLIDRVVYRDQAYKSMKLMAGLEEDDKVPLVKLGKYKKLESHIEQPETRDRIAILVADGEIRDGKSEEGVVGSETLVKELKRLKNSDRVKGIVLRVNSPGGGGMASDEIWREIQLVREKKPVVTSMSDLAASGGYYISMGTDYIYAEPNTITGSIGVFALLFDMTDFFGNKLGITRDNVKTGEYSDIMSPLHHLSDAEREIIQNYAESFYDNFITKAAEGRDTSPEAINEIGQGRVWTGVQAKENGLVDELGSLDDAIEKAAELAEVDEYRIRYYPKPKNYFERMFEGLSAQIKTESFSKELGVLYPLLLKVKELDAKKGLWARLPMGWSLSY